jgi:hypothetical protein
MSATDLDSAIASSRTTGRAIYTWAAIVAALVVLAGFSRTYYAKAAFATPELTTLLHLHGLVMTSWFVIFAVQVRLAASRRLDIHRKMGWAGACIALLVLIVGTITAIRAAAEGRAPQGVPPLAFLAIPLGDMLVFATLVAAAIWLRRKPEFHKRFMLMATLGILTAAIARIPFEPLQQGGLPAFFGATDLLLLGFVMTDTVKQRRLHPAYAIGLGVVIAMQAIRAVGAGSPQWLAMARWLTS